MAHVRYYVYKYKKYSLSTWTWDWGKVYKWLRPFKPETQPNLPGTIGSHGLALTFCHLLLSSPLQHRGGSLPSGPNSQPAWRLCGPSGTWGRQVTNLNGARILCVVQQPDGAAVFPFQISVAATHESAQHLFQKKKKNNKKNNKALLPASVEPEQ